MIVAVAVAIAMCTMCSRGKPWRVKTNVSAGTMIIPPPSPSSPARNPVNAPRTRNATMSVGSIVRSGLTLRELHDEVPLRRLDGRHRQPVAPLQDAHLRELGLRAQFGERNEPCLLDQRD